MWLWGGLWNCNNSPSGRACIAGTLAPRRRRQAWNLQPLNVACNRIHAAVLKDKETGARLAGDSPARSALYGAQSFVRPGVDIIVAERCLNHSLGGLVAVYDQHDYLTERRAALDTWCSFLQACELGKDWNVVPMRKAAA